MQVEFIHISDEYQILEDIKFTIKLNDYQVQEGDRIAIYKIGWKEVQDYEIFDWAPTNTTDTEISFNFKGNTITGCSSHFNSYAQKRMYI